jgi:hypothetical protein
LNRIGRRWRAFGLKNQVQPTVQSSRVKKPRATERGLAKFHPQLPSGDDNIFFSIPLNSQSWFKACMVTPIRDDASDSYSPKISNLWAVIIMHDRFHLNMQCNGHPPLAISQTHQSQFIASPALLSCFLS